VSSTIESPSGPCPVLLDSGQAVGTGVQAVGWQGLRVPQTQICSVSKAVRCYRDSITCPMGMGTAGSPTLQKARKEMSAQDRSQKGFILAPSGHVTFSSPVWLVPA